MKSPRAALAVSSLLVTGHAFLTSWHPPAAIRSTPVPLSGTPAFSRVMKGTGGSSVMMAVKEDTVVDLVSRVNQPLGDGIRTKFLSLFSAIEAQHAESEFPSSDEILSAPMEPFPSMSEEERMAGAVRKASTEVIPAGRPEPCPYQVNEKINRISDRIPNAWLGVCNSADLKPKSSKKVVVDNVPICLFRTASGEVRAISDVCLHRAAALSEGAVDDDMVVCPYHGYKFDGEGKLRYIPGVDEGLLGKRSEKVARTVWYKTFEQGGLVYIFPDAMRAGAIEQHVKPFLLPEAVDPTFRAIEGTAEINAAANLVVENLLDTVHISFVHSFGNMQEPLPYSDTYQMFYDDEASQLLPYARTTFKYRSGPRSISKVVGKVDEVVVENEFHLPYTTVTRVRFGKDTKTVMVAIVPLSENRSVLHYKLYRNFMYLHPKDESVINKSLDNFFQSVMQLTLNEDKTILESLYHEHQAGYVLFRYDKPLKLYRRAVKEFLEATKAREDIAERRTLEMDLLRLVETTERGRKATKNQHSTILSIVGALEKVYSRQCHGGETMASKEVDDNIEKGIWHLVYANPGDVDSLIPGAGEGAEAAGLHGRVACDRTIEKRLRSAGGERWLLDFRPRGRPIWQDTEESIQSIDTTKSILSNIATYRGLLGIKTTVQLNGQFLKSGPNRKDVLFKSAQVDLGGFKVVFPHMDLFGVSGWLETTFVDEHLRICRGNRGSVFVLTRRPLKAAAAFA